ncbi:MAG: ribonuclease D [Planctomycetales bacterium]|nr:ribonuclease D [Planctomycetales bacterium]NIM08572.1 ribonuclease D [Planctomycetales bacterium]NIN08041.1 ribonuclease D [Planctomycetales bacterium]NIN77177.1 ribonuclease D [Planctomycetales bacterium]NIO34359.1 ribonuclease D [Planctomycetales bacterium]
MDYDRITTDDQLAELTRRIGAAEKVALDTEFVAEHSYRPQLCLVQLSLDGQLAIIDPLKIRDMDPLWRGLARGDHETIVHAGREEIVFSMTAIDAVPARLFDVQIAAGLIGLEYPAGYGSLAQKLLGASPAKGETRTDWRRRPLSEQQLQYALNDVAYLEPMRNQLVARLEQLDRTQWLADEMQRWTDQVRDAQQRDRWRRVSGIGNLSPRVKAIVRELWRWREGEAERRNQPPRRVLRDDLLVELARRHTTDPKRIRAVRGMDRSDLRHAYGQLADCIRRGKQIPDAELPQAAHRRPLPAKITMLGQFLASAVGSLCHQASLAPSIVGNPTDVRELIAYRLGYFHKDDPPPALAVGWRAEMIGSVLDDLLAGKLAIRITDAESDEPLAFEPVGE